MGKETSVIKTNTTNDEIFGEINPKAKDNTTIK